MANILLIAGAILIVAGLIIKYGKKNEVQNKREPSIQPKNTSSTKDNSDENKAKGDAFEKYVVLKFDTGYFTIKEWRSDKIVNGIYPVSNHFPDLEIEFNYRKKQIRDTFAVECKYRNGFYKNIIEWAQGYQLDNYKKYAAEIKIPVFIVIGVGGQPEYPSEVYIVPLEKIKNTVFTRDFLSSYKMENKNQHFYWDIGEKVLR